MAGALAKKKVVAFDVGELRHQVVGLTVWGRFACVRAIALVLAVLLCWVIRGRYGCGGVMDVLQGRCPCRVKRGGPGRWQGRWQTRRWWRLMLVS
jgi:hypothetical protein